MKVDINTIMQAMSPHWRYMWCSANVCGCLGCANASGGLLAAGFSRADWQIWVNNNPNPDPSPQQPYIHPDMKQYLTQLIPHGDKHKCKDETNF